MGEWQIPGTDLKLVNVHDETPDCDISCMIHNPSAHIQNRENWPYHWRSDRGLMERICEHGVGHPDLDSAAFHDRIGQGRAMNTHGCDLVDGVPCCQRTIED